MMPSIKRISFITAMLAMCLACNDDFELQGLPGEWTWVESQGGFGGWTRTPESEGITRELIITGSRYREFVNDTLVLDEGYDLGISDESLIGTTARTFIRLDNGRMQAIEVGKEQFELFDQCFDCFRHRYVRK